MNSINALLPNALRCKCIVHQVKGKKKSESLFLTIEREYQVLKKDVLEKYDDEHFER